MLDIPMHMLSTTLAQSLPRLCPDLPRPTGRLIPAQDLLPADILLSRGTSTIADAVVAGDGGSYSHAALWSGSGVIETTLNGTGEFPLNGDRDVYRFRCQSGTLPARVAARIIDFARAQLAHGYARSELCLLAVLHQLGLVPKRSLLRFGLGLLGSEHADAIEEWLQHHVDKRAPRICSELVAVAYYRAAPSRKYALQILPRDMRPRTDGLADNVDDSHRDPLRQQSRERKILCGAVALSAVSRTPLPVVTPGDLQFSPSLTFVGRLQDRCGDVP